MQKQYKTLFTGGEGEIIEKRSRFIASIKPVETEEEANTFIEEIRKKYYDARHHCFAFIIGTKLPIERCSDDGEPSGTAGKPMLEVITGAKLYNLAVVVTRYFGGTLLGTGGLVRAYTQAVQEGLKQCKIIEKELVQRQKLRTNYTDIGKIQYLINTEKIYIESTEYTDQVEVSVLVPVEKLEELKKQLIEITSGRIQIEDQEQFYYADVDGEIVIFEA